MTEPKDIQGWLTETEGQWLMDTARICKRPILEIGTFQGRSTAFIARGSYNGSNVPVYTCDTHDHIIGIDTYPIACRHFYELENVAPIIPFKFSSRRLFELLPQHIKFDFVFIDGDHSYEGCLLDYEHWSKRVAEGGIIALHDAQPLNGGGGFEGVAKVAEEKIKKQVNNYGICDRICWRTL